MYDKYIKQVLDVILSGIILIIFLPIIIILIILINLLHMGSDTFFRQKRPGYLGKPFYLYKFCTMNYACDNAGNLLPDEKRITKLGKFLRKSSLDELPELFNVLKGEMSLVGPRPLLMEYLPLYSQEQVRRHDVRPGITGWAQVNGRNELSWHKKFEMDVWYVDNLSFILDIKILWLTLWKVLKREGISQKGHVTTEKFKGNI